MRSNNINTTPTVKGCFSCPYFDKCPQDCRGFIVSGEETFCPKKDNPTGTRLYMSREKHTEYPTLIALCIN